MTTKQLFSIEYDFHASRQMLFQYLSTPSGLGEWFADDVNSRGENFTFIDLTGFLIASIGVYIATRD